MPSRKTRSFVDDNAAYEAWLASQCAVVEDDLERKRKRMRRDAFVFLRATYFRWSTRIEAVCPELGRAPRVLCVGDVHLENFGTWRDAESRLVWGVNDFDEAAEMPYAFDLVRLATSARLAPKSPLRGREIAAFILEGYGEGLAQPRPTLLDEQEQWMRPYVACSDEERAAFLGDVLALPHTTPPEAVQAGLLRSLPTGAGLVRYARRTAGIGSLGRPRFVAIASYRGGTIVREAKAIVPSAWSWAHPASRIRPVLQRLTRGVHRSPDPFLAVHGGFVYRRIAADSRKVELNRPGGAAFVPDLLRAMAFDLAAIHVASRGKADALRIDLARRPYDWLRAASKRAERDVSRDHDAWRKAS